MVRNAIRIDHVADKGACARCGKVTQTYCMGCNKYYCVNKDDCFYLYHTNDFGLRWYEFVDVLIAFFLVF